MNIYDLKIFLSVIISIAKIYVLLQRNTLIQCMTDIIHKSNQINIKSPYQHLIYNYIIHNYKYMIMKSILYHI